MKRVLVVLVLLGAVLAVPALAATPYHPMVIRVDVNNRYDRTSVANTGVTILKVYKDYVYVMGSADDLAEITALGYKATIVDAITDFPPADSAFHNYSEVIAELNQTAADHPSLVTISSIGPSLLGRQLWAAKVTNGTGVKPVAFICGLHHAREHLTVEVALALLKKLTDEYATNPTIKGLVDSLEIWIVPMVNPDGGEQDISTGSYQYWRKNMRNNGDGTYGVDLNRNYEKFFGGPGSSGNTGDETYHGPSAFSEPETQAIRDFFNAHDVSVSLSYHSYAELVLWPDNGDYNDVPDPTDRQVFTTIGQQMGAKTGYTAEPGYDLYLSSGEMCDYLYYQHHVFAYTIELSPDTFYPPGSYIPTAIAENMDAALYLLSVADDPYKVIAPGALAISPASASLKVGDTQTFSASGGTRPYTFTSSNTAVATIDATSGALVAKGVGTTTITLRDSASHSVTAGVTVAKAGLCALAGSDSAPLGALLLVLSAILIARRRR